MAPRKPKVQKVLPPLPEATSPFTLNQGYYRGLSDNPPQYGQIPVPSGSIGCLAGITFVVTGTLPSLRREEVKSLIEKYGGKVTGSISGRTDIIIRGCLEVGPKKLEEAKTRGIPVIDQEGLFKIIADSNPFQQQVVKKEEPKQEIKKEDAKKEDENIVELSEKQFPKSSLLTEKYRPRCIDDLVGNAGPINQLKQWLINFPKNEKKIALINGRPGLGKSTAASLVAGLCGYHVNEFNASDVRSKSALTEIINATDSLTFHRDSNGNGNIGKTVLIFDEVDGISVGDRGGIQTIASFAKTTKIPIICICNNTNDRKFDPLLNVSLIITFFEPPIHQIVERLKYICHEEKINISEEILKGIAMESKGDLRYCINNIQYWSGNGNGISEKNFEVTDVLSATLKIFSKTSTLDEKFDSFFYDYSVVPYYIEENLNFADRHGWAEQLDNIALGDEIENLIRDTNNWGLLNAKCVVSSIIPSTYTNPKVPIFSLVIPKLYGFNSKQAKFARYISEISNHIHDKSPILPNDIYDSLGELILALFENKLKKKAKDSIIDLLDELSLTLDDLEHLIEFVEYKSTSSKSTTTASKKYEAILKDVNKLYKKMHTTKNKVESLSEIRSDYLYVKTMEKKKGKKK